MKNYQFPENFKWGSAVWATGVEGAADKDGKAETVWDKYYRQSPERFYLFQGPDKTLNWYEDYDQYAQLAADLHHNSFRTSILWARLMPDGEHVNEKAVEFYKNEFRAFRSRGMELSVVLYWFDMPALFEDKGGFTNRDVIEPFVKYCKTCFELFQDDVDIWYIYNEPIVDCMNKYLNDSCYPNKVDWKAFNQAVYNMTIAHARVVAEYQKTGCKAKIGSVINHGHIYPRSNNEADLKAAHEDKILTQNCFEDPFLNGKTNEEWLKLVNETGADIQTNAEDQKLLSENTIHFCGLNYYAPERVMCPPYVINPQAPVTFDNFAYPYVMPGRRMNYDRGWEIYPKALYDSLMDLSHEYDYPEIRITENGIGIQNEDRYRNEDGMIEDDYRIDYVKEHLEWAWQAIRDGVKLTGYNMWSFVDLWSPSNQFKNCYGFYEYNLKDGSVKAKKSAAWFRKITDQNGFED